jgi:predicted permease
VSGIARRLKARFGEDTWMVDAEVLPLKESLTGSARPALLVLSAAVGCLLLVACANVANLLLAQAAGRRRELAVRMAVGAGRRDLVRQLLAEALVLSLLGGAGGILVASWGVRALLSFEPGNLPRADGVGLDLPVLVFALGIGLATALGIGVLTALRATRGTPGVSLHQGERAESGGSGRRTLDLLVLSQVAATVVLLVGAGLLGRSLLRLLAVDPGFRAQGVLAMDVSFDDAGEARQVLARRLQLYDELETRLLALPGVHAVGAVNAVPLGGGGADGTFLVIDHEPSGLAAFEALARDPSLTGEAEFRVATASYFRALGIRLESGRLFDDADGPDAPPVAVISASLARARWPQQNPIGVQVEFGNMDGDLRLFMIVGVVSDVRDVGLEREPRPIFYVNFR